MVPNRAVFVEMFVFFLILGNFGRKPSTFFRILENFKTRKITLEQSDSHRQPREYPRQSRTHFRREKWIKKTVFSQNPENPQSDCFRKFMFKLIFVCSKYDFWVPGKVLDRGR